MYKFLTALLSVLTVAGCTGVPRVVAIRSEPAQYAAFFVPAAAAGPVWVQVAGSPFPGYENDTAAVAVAEVSRVVRWIDARFTAVRAEAGDPRFRVVVGFARSPGPGFTPCDPRPPDPWQPGERVFVRVVFCNEDRAMNVAEGSVDDADTPDSPAFRKLMWLTAAHALPQPRPESGSKPDVLIVN